MSVFVNIGARVGSSMNSAATGIERRFGQLNRKLRIQAAETKLAFREMAGAMTPLAAMAAAGGLTMGLKGILGNGNEYAHQLSQMRMAGRTSMEMARAVAQANKTMRDLPTSTLNDNLKVMNETTLAFGSFTHAAENLTFVQKMSTMLDNMLGDHAGDKGENAKYLIRAMEMRGMGTAEHKGFDRRRFQSESGKLYQAMIASGGTVNPQEFFGYMQQANPYMKAMSTRFLYRIAPSLMQEYGGDRAGTMQNTWTGTILGKAKNKISTEAWMKLGLLDPKQVVYNKVGPVGWKAGAIKGTNLALSDPLAWTESFLKPALKKMGINTGDQLSLAKGLMPLFRDRNAMRLANNLVGDQDNARLHKDEGLYQKVMGVDSAFTQAMANDPKMAIASTASSMKNLETIMGKAVNKQVIASLQVMARAINWLAGAFDRHPNFARGAIGLMAFGAVAATLKVFGIALRWVLSPFRIFGRLLAWFSSTRLAGMFVNGIMRLGPLALRGLIALGPWLLRGVAAAFGLLSNPVGWAILAASAALLIYKYRGAIASAWNSVTSWFTTTAWPSVANTVSSINWASIGMSIADGLTFGLASRLPNMMRSVGDVMNTPLVNFVNGKGVAWSAPAGAPAMPTGAPRRSGRSGTIVPAGARAQAWSRALGGGASMGDVHIHGANDPHSTRKILREELKRMSRSQAAGYND
jgi:hypothetical protein